MKAIPGRGAPESLPLDAAGQDEIVDCALALAALLADPSVLSPGPRSQPEHAHTPVRNSAPT
jgi:hypothetical protein